MRLTDLVIVDTDADRLPNWWEDQFGLSKTNAADATLDLDGDGASNLNEFLSGTKPNDAASVFRITALRPEGATGYDVCIGIVVEGLLETGDSHQLCAMRAGVQ